MRTLSVSSFNAIEAEFQARRNAVLVARLRTEMNVVPTGMSDADVIAQIMPVIKDARALGFAEDENDLLRFVALAFLPEPARQDPFLSDNFQRCLGNVEYHPSDRLDFAYKHIVPKAYRFCAATATENL
ncbi:MAG TPA: hypothetical protein PK677_13930 [Acidiphilium sp.]|uniref:hypothetical protein n=1 Tax=Acidiphilium sp. TaxID=527 RepID=UPI000BCA74E4|nr:hypothetical protein [Acidiphilium sp.]OZB39383.1 MAG: hypothetical protein B7X48_09255 [Acidiphilium sp. 34-60-192]HQT89627.1 hypothetical protein [Acidiphilium sp.]